MRSEWAVFIAAMVFAVAPARAEEQQTCTTVFDFEGSDAIEAWETTNDNVMGGKSSGGPSIGDGVLTFSGSTNTDGGGFSSIKASVPKRSLDGTTAFRVRYKGDGRRFLFSTETGERRWLFFRIQYWSEFEAKETGDWEEVTLPIDGFQAHYMGEPIDGRVLDPARIKDLGFFIYDKKDGPFALEVDWIKACS